MPSLRDGDAGYRAHLCRRRIDLVDDGECGFLVRDRQVAAGKAERGERAQRRAELTGLDGERHVAALEPVLLEPVVVQLRRARVHHRPAHDAGEQETIGVGHMTTFLYRGLQRRRVALAVRAPARPPSRGDARSIHEAARKIQPQPFAFFRRLRQRRLGQRHDLDDVAVGIVEVGAAAAEGAVAPVLLLEDRDALGGEERPWP